MTKFKSESNKTGKVVSIPAPLSGFATTAFRFHAVTPASAPTSRRVAANLRSAAFAAFVRQAAKNCAAISHRFTASLGRRARSHPLLDAASHWPMGDPPSRHALVWLPFSRTTVLSLPADGPDADRQLQTGND